MELRKQFMDILSSKNTNKKKTFTNLMIICLHNLTFLGFNKHQKFYIKEKKLTIVPIDVL